MFRHLTGEKTGTSGGEDVNNNKCSKFFYIENDTVCFTTQPRCTDSGCDREEACFRKRCGFPDAGE